MEKMVVEGYEGGQGSAPSGVYVRRLARDGYEDRVRGTCCMDMVHLGDKA